MIINPAPHPLSRLIPWDEFWYPVSQLGEERLLIIEDQIIQKQAEVFPSLAAGKRKQLMSAREDNDYRRELVRVALTIGELTAFACYPLNDKGFEIRRFVWDFADAVGHDAYRSIDEGELALEPGAVRSNSLASQLANQPLFVRNDDKYRWLDVKTPSEADQHRIAQSVIEEHIALYGESKMRRLDFVGQVCERRPGLSKEGAKRLWREFAKADWKRAGTKAHRSKRH